MLAPIPISVLDNNRVAFDLANSMFKLWDPEKAWPEHVQRRHFCCINCNGKTRRAGRSKVRRVLGLKGHFFFCGIKYKCNKCSCSDSGSTSFDSKLNNQSLSPPNTTKRPLTRSSKSAAPLSRVAACGFRPVCALACLRSPYLSNDCPPSGCSLSWSKQNAVKHACFSLHLVVAVSHGQNRMQSNKPASALVAGLLTLKTNALGRACLCMWSC